MPKIFICYRRDDSQHAAGRICEGVSDRFGTDAVVFDVGTIPLGTDFDQFLDNELSTSDVVLVVIGNQWLELLHERRDDPGDFVRIEIQTALERQIRLCLS